VVARRTSVTVGERVNLAVIVVAAIVAWIIFNRSGKRK
jgi:hypothetical protein